MSAEIATEVVLERAFSELVMEFLLMARHVSCCYMECLYANVVLGDKAFGASSLGPRPQKLEETKFGYSATRHGVIKSEFSERFWWITLHKREDAEAVLDRVPPMGLQLLRSESVPLDALNKGSGGLGKVK